MSSDDLVKRIAAMMPEEEPLAFISEYRGDLRTAIQQHHELADRLQEPLTAIKNKNKLGRVGIKEWQFGVEKQLSLSRERAMYLQSLIDEGKEHEIVLLPTATAAAHEMQNLRDKCGYCISLCHDDPEMAKFFEEQHATPLSDFLSANGSTAADATHGATYYCTMSSHLIFMGLRPDFTTIKDSTEKHIMYEIESMWEHKKPKTSLKFRRGCNKLPNKTAISIAPAMAPKQGHMASFQQTRSAPRYAPAKVLEIPDRIKFKSDWSPRAFTYGGRSFVWLCPDPKLRKRPVHEELHEYKIHTPVEGGKTGKMQYETTGERLAYGKQLSDNKHTFKSTRIEIWIAPGIDQRFREHIVASLAAMLTIYYTSWREVSPALKNLQVGAKGLQGTVSLLSLLSS